MKIFCRWLSIILSLLISLFSVLDAQPAIAQESYKLGEDALQRGDYIQAIQHFTDCLENTPHKESGKTFTRLGYAYSQLGRYVEATRAYQDALCLDSPNDQTHAVKAQALYTLSWLCYRAGKYSEAETAVLEAIKLALNNPIYQEGLKEIQQCLNKSRNN